eukprot:CAMPEP_0195507032 /NCGR_PEP_ID=MMETSP0794_2-20130614/558_1 /TAXON_ID=515487 /ORGANISM="Stephanopyxis turris, Strain CCMP 815" /LENGTH=425 /DNA_ID=CAMNT_0040633565 /DNA_START=40 /DNA_END=1317 /DNA_ORIENTATION=+
MSSRSIACVCLISLISFVAFTTVQVGKERSKYKPSSVQRKTSVERDLKYLTFGTSQTWGSTLTNRFEQAYPYLLSPDVKNLAIRGAGPQYPSLCTESMVGDELYDVIVLEYPHGETLGELSVLARRLRQRFPDAIMIFTQYWYPLQVYVREQGREMSLTEWAELKDVGFLNGEFMEEFHKTSVIRDFWQIFPFFALSQEKVAKEVGAHMYILPRPKTEELALEGYRHLFNSEDMHHLSERGHKEFARGIKEIVEEALGTYPVDPRLGTWGEGDKCISWYESGECPLEHSANVILKPLDERYGFKNSLEIGLGGGAVTIENTFDSPHSLYLSFMATGPSKSRYPTTELHFEPRMPGVESVIIEPHSNKYKFSHHVALMEKVGVVRPGKTVLIFQPIEEAQYPFRLVSVALVSEDTANANSKVTISF